MACDEHELGLLDVQNEVILSTEVLDMVGLGLYHKLNVLRVAAGEGNDQVDVIRVLDGGYTWKRPLDISNII